MLNQLDSSNFKDLAYEHIVPMSRLRILEWSYINLDLFLRPSSELATQGKPLLPLNDLKMQYLDSFEVFL